ncbi:MAG: ABC transporter ATP-binding protein, partial [Desulfuromonadaceae bacterium]
MASIDKNVYRRLLTYSKKYFWRIIIAMLASLGVAGVDVKTAQLVEPFVDKVLSSSDYALINLVPMIIMALALVKGASRFVQEYYIKTAGQLVVQDIRNDLYGHSLGLSMGYFSRTSSGHLMSRILNDVGILQSSAANVLVDFLRESVTLIGLIGLAFYQDWRLASVAFAVLPIAVLPAAHIGRKIKENTRRGQSTLGNLTAVLQETFAGIKVIKAFGTESREIERFRSENKTFYRFIRKVLKYDSASAPVMELLGYAGMAGVLWYGLHRMLDGAITKGELMSFVTALAMMYNPVKRLAKVNNTVQKSIGAASRVFEVVDEIPDIQDAEHGAEIGRVSGEVVFDRVVFGYGDELVLKDFSVTARPGEVVALVGPSGAGKSTVVGLLARFYDPLGGVIMIDGNDIRQVTQCSLKANLAFVDQETFLFNDSIANNIRYGKPEATDEEVLGAAKQAFADEFIRELPAGYETNIGDRGTRLSGGQRQRVCIARALLRNAPILILDEATSALDTESEAMVQRALNNLMKDRTTFVIAHRLSTVMHADK